MFRGFLSGFCLFGIFLWHQTLIWIQPRICKAYWLRLLTPDRKWTTCCQTFSTASFVGRLLGWEKVISSNDWCWLASLVVKTILRNLPNWGSASLLHATWTTLQLPAVSWWKKSSQPFEISETLQPKQGIKSYRINKLWSFEDRNLHPKFPPWIQVNQTPKLDKTPYACKNWCWCRYP